MMTKISIGLGRKETQVSSHASLASLAPVIEAKQIFAPIYEHVKIEQKQVLYSPSDKLIFVVLGILSGAEYIWDINLKLRPDKPLLTKTPDGICRSRRKLRNALRENSFA